MEKVFSVCFILMQWVVITLGEETNITITVLNETDFKDIKNASVLRYGHHKIKCVDYKKAYACIMMCLERGFDIANSELDCSCKCFKDEVKARYYGGVSRGWKIPTTSKPAWAGGSPDKPGGKLQGGEYVYTIEGGSIENLQQRKRTSEAQTELISTIIDADNTDDGGTAETHDGEEHSEEGSEDDHEEHSEEHHEEEEEEEEHEEEGEAEEE